VRYLSQSLVLPVVDLVVSHAGAGGMVGALMHGLPHLMLPGRAQSQLASSEAVDRLGAGIRLQENERESADISDAASRLYGDPRFAAAAASIRAGLDELPSPTQVLRVVEELAGRRGSRS